MTTHESAKAILRRLRREEKRKRRKNLDHKMLAIGVKKQNTNRRPINVLERNVDFPRLLDSKYDRQLKIEFAKYANNAEYFYDAVATITAYLKAKLNSREVVESAGGHAQGIYANLRKPELGYIDEINDYKKQSVNGQYLKIKGREIQLNLETLSFSVCFNPRVDEAREEILNNLKILFGKDIKIPAEWQRENRQAFVDLGELNTGLQPLRYFRRLRFESNEASGMYMPTGFSMSGLTTERDFDNNKDTLNTLTFDIKLDKANVIGLTDLRDRGNLQPNSILQLNFKVMGVVTLPLEYALWVTNAISLKDFVPKIFREHFNKIGMTKIGIGKVKRGPKPKNNGKPRPISIERTTGVSAVKRLNEDRIKEFNIKVIPRVNEDNFCIRSNGAIYYLPPEDKADFYVKTLRDSYDQETGLVKTNEEIPEIYNLPLMVDWLNDVFLYTNSNGHQEARQLSGAIALDNVTIAKYLNARLTTIVNTEGIGSVIIKYAEEICTKNNLYNPALKADSSRKIYAQSYSALIHYLATRYTGLRIVDLVKEANIVANNKTPDSITPEDAPLILEFVRLNTEVAKHFMDQTQIPISARCTNMFYYYLLGKYAAQSEALNKEFYEKASNNRQIPEADLPKKFAIPNLPAIDSVLPHQAQYIAQSMKFPECQVLEVQTGGGKTMMMIIDAILHLQSNKANRIAVVVPGGLVKEWTSEINKASQGLINAFPIDTSTILKIAGEKSILKWDRKQYINYLLKMPKNTLFVISANFLKLTKDYFTGVNYKDKLQVGEDVAIKFFPNVQMLRQLNIDMLLIDESHYFKNENSARTKALKSFAPTAQRRRIASGTINPNSPVDQASQFGILNPAIYGDAKSFIERYGVLEGTKMIGFQPGGEAAINRDAEPYTTRIVKTRRDWAFLLPVMRTDYIFSNLTPLQKKYYDIMIAKKTSELKNDPKILALLAKADEKSQKELEKKLARSLIPIELFINAPDTDPIYKEKFNPEGEDLVSWKVGVINNLVEKHFKQDPNKVIIYCWNKAVSRHIWRYCNFRNIAIHYSTNKPESREGEENIVTTGQGNLLRFRNDTKIKVLIADATSIREGLNLQLASLVIRVQSLYAPGWEIQENARAVRPDVKNIYKRKFIKVRILQTNHTLEMGKTARLLAKSIITRRLLEEGDPKWNSFIKKIGLQDLPPIKLNLDMLQKYNTVKDFAEYFSTQQEIEAWDVQQHDDSINELIQKVAKERGLDPKTIDVSDLRNLALLANDGSGKIAGTASAWVPLAAGSIPYDPRDLNLKPLIILTKEKEIDDEGDDDDDDEPPDEDDEGEGEDKGEEENIVTTYAPGDIVFTEFGYGYINPNSTADRDATVNVLIPGFTQPRGITLSKQSVFKPMPPAAEGTDEHMAWTKRVRRLEKDLTKAGDKGILFINGGIMAGMPAKTAPEPEVKPVKTTPKLPPHPASDPNRPKVIVKVPNTDDKAGNNVKPAVDNSKIADPVTKPKPPKNIPNAPVNKNKSRIEVDVMLINGIPAVTIYADESNHSRLNQYGAWDHVPAFWNAEVQNLRGAQNLVKALREHFPSTSDSSLKSILDMAKRLTGRTSTNLRVRQNVSLGKVKQWMQILNHRPPGYTDQNGHFVKLNDGIRIYPTIFDDVMYICVPVGVQSKQASKLRSLKIPGVTAFTECDEMLVHFCRNIKIARTFLDRLAEGENLVNYNNSVARLSDPEFKRVAGLISFDTD